MTEQNLPTPETPKNDEVLSFERYKLFKEMGILPPEAMPTPRPAAAPTAFSGEAAAAQARAQVQAQIEAQVRNRLAQQAAQEAALKSSSLANPTTPSTDIVPKPKGTIARLPKFALARRNEAGPRSKHEFKRWQTVGAVTGVLAVAATLTTGVATKGFNFADGSDAVANAPTFDTNLSDIEVGRDKFGARVCKLPENVPLVITLEGYTPLDIKLPTGEGEGDAVNTLVSTPAFLSDEYWNNQFDDDKIDSKQLNEMKTKLKDFYTFDKDGESDGRFHQTLNQAPVYVSICALNENAIITKPDGAFEITLPSLEVTLQGPEELFQKEGLIYTSWQQFSANPETDPERGEFNSLPYDYFLGPKEGNDVYNNALAAFEKATTPKSEANPDGPDPLQIADLYARSMISSANQVMNGIDGENGIDLPDVNLPNVIAPGEKTNFQHVIMEAIVQRLGADPNKIIWYGAEFPINIKFATDPASGKSITEVHTLVGVVPEETVLTNVEVKFGKPAEPVERVAEPTPEPEETATETEAPKAP